jgi:hypothetical protein
MTNESYQALMDENQSRKDEIEELRKVNESLMVQVQELRKDQVMLESLRNELANQYTKV